MFIKKLHTIYKFTFLQFNISNNNTLPTILFFFFVRIFKIHIFEYSKAGIVGSHSLGLFMHVSGLCMAIFISNRERYIQKFSKYWAIKKYWIFKIKCNIAKQDGKKIQSRKISFESCSCRFLTDKRIKNKRFVWDFKKIQIATNDLKWT